MSAVHSGEFAGQVAWVVGASGDIGKAICRALRCEGAHVVASSRSADAALQAQLSAPDQPALSALPVDITRRESVDAACEQIMQRHGRVDMLVNTTSVSIFGPFLELSDEQWLTVYQSKVLGYLRTIRAVVPHMVKQGGGRIVNMSGRGGHQPTLPVHLPGMTASAAVNLMTKGLANMYGAQGIRINAVAPGPVESARYRTALQSHQQAKNAGTSAGGFNTPTVSGQLIQPEEVANVTLFLLSSRSSSMTGTLLQADGGSTASL